MTCLQAQLLVDATLAQQVKMSYDSILALQKEAPDVSLSMTMLLQDPVGNVCIKVDAAEVSVAGGCQHLQHPFKAFQQRQIKRAATQVKHQNRPNLLMLQLARQGGGNGLCRLITQLQQVLPSGGCGNSA